MMARPFQNPYEPVNSPGTDSPLSPYPRGDTPISFKTNVNRAKTKRWVEAKKISYDGNDWGDDDFNEYDEDPTPPVPQPRSLNQSTSDLPGTLSRDVPRPWLPSIDRSRSMDQVATLGTNTDSRSQSGDRQIAQDQSGPFRPADIYKRLRGQAGPSHAPTLSRSSTEPVPMTGPAVQNASRESSQPPVPPTEGITEEMQPPQSVSPKAHNAVPVIGLPDVKRLSGFGSDFATTSPSAQPDQTTESQESQLHHNPSVGFRSMVHQAFDVPETPSTSIESIARSDSNSTSLISPIFPNRGSNDQTPTIAEEPESTSPLRDSNDRGLVFKPGHRRDLSVPKPDNSPLRRPVIMNNDNIPPESLAEMSSGSPDLPQEHQQQSAQPSTTSPKDRPPPLRVSSGLSLGSGENTVPVIVPSMSTENSPQDTENDRLRKEIIRSLSRENTPSDEPDHDNSRPQTGRQDSLIPSEYERYWNETGGDSPLEQYQPAVGYDTPQNVSQEPYSSSPLQASSPDVNSSETRPKLKKRFSWESTSSEEPTPTQEPMTTLDPMTTVDPTPITDIQSPPVGPVPGQFPTSDEGASPRPDTPTHPQEHIEDEATPEKPKLTIIPPSATDNNSIISGRYLPEVVDAHTVGDAYAPPVAEQQTPTAVPTQSPSIEASLLGFREILEMKTSDERVQAFDKTRSQFMTINTGLNNWLQVMVHAHPEYTDVVQQSLKQSPEEPKLAVSRGKFPKLSSLGNLVSSHQDGAGTGTGHVRRPSAHLGSMMNKQHVEQRSKEFLHTAGVFGGKAGEAAKGLFAKGRSKFKGGSDKGFESSRGYRRKFSFSELAIEDPEENKRRTVHFGSLPLLNGARAPANRYSLDIKRKQVSNVARKPAAALEYPTDPEPSAPNGSYLDPTYGLEKEVVAALRFSDAESSISMRGSDQDRAEYLAELEAPPSNHAIEDEVHQELPADYAASVHSVAAEATATTCSQHAVQPCRDCPPRKPLSREKDITPPMSPIQVAINDAPLLTPEFHSERQIGDKIRSWTERENSLSDQRSLSNDPVETPAAAASKRFYSSVMETPTRGASAQPRLQPAPSISSLGTEDPKRSLNQILGQANASKISFLSEGANGPRQSLGVISRPDHNEDKRCRDRPKSPWPDEAELALKRLSGVFRPSQPKLSTMDRLKVVGNKIRRSSMSDSTEKTGRKAMDKLSVC
ncbi:hypothetical protein BDV25DRAFT_157568 [Aspergillus avenaceus]|uniref:Uncharacterized protein n=1 Tax=Aspergillus avenaceus TaxID=36643 RepID=A0A5N6TR02_ASPAV|nr:hypothetical protein BDV25DRAFT_157568 [Aspergillus avenaceus]